MKNFPAVALPLCPGAWRVALLALPLPLLLACSHGAIPPPPSLEEQARYAMERNPMYRATGADASRLVRDGREVVVIGRGLATPAVTAPPVSVVSAPLAPAPALAPAATAAPRAVAPAAPVDAPAPAVLERELTLALEGWRQAWQAGDAAGYLRFYAPGFKGDAVSRSAWERQRRARLANGRITVRFDDVQASVKGSDADVRFVQHYTSARHSDTGRKHLQLRRRDGSWEIVAESWARR